MTITKKTESYMKKIINLLISLKWVCLILVILLLGYPIGYFVLDSNKLDNSISISAMNRDEVEGTGAYIINLNRSKERYEYIKDSVKNLGLKVERIEAIDGSTLSVEEISEKVDLKSYKAFLGHLPKLGTIGCSLSHIKVWQTFLESNLEFAVIFEDDVSFDPNEVKTIIEDLTKNSKLWDVAILEIHHTGCPLTIKTLVNNHHLAVYLVAVTHTGAYVINRKAAKNLLEKVLPIKMPIDHYFTRAWELDIKFTGVENPRIVHQTFGESEIAKTEEISGEDLNTLDSLKRFMYSLQSDVIRFLYNLKLYLSMKLQIND